MKKRCSLRSKKGQMTIFIIIGVLIVSALALFFVFRSDIIPGIGIGAEQSPNVFLASCLDDDIREGLDLISLQGGSMENQLNISFKFEDERFPIDISYLCYSRNEYELCVNQEPMLFSQFKEKMYYYLEDSVRSCFNDLILSLEKRGYVVDAIYRDFEVLRPKITYLSKELWNERISTEVLKSSVCGKMQYLFIF